MPAAKTRPTPAGAKAAAARAERNGGAKSCEWRGLTFTLPSKLPASVMFDWAEVETAEGIAPLFQFIVGLIGSEQFAMFREKVNSDEIPLDEFDETIVEFLDTLCEPYGVSLGESPASPNS